jgi:hypothetical protein
MNVEVSELAFGKRDRTVYGRCVGSPIAPSIVRTWRDRTSKHRSLFVWLSADRNLLKWLTFMVWRNLDDDFLVEFIARRIRRWIKRFQKGLAVELLFQQSRSHFA